MRVLLVGDFALTGGTRTYLEMLISLFSRSQFEVSALLQETYFDDAMTNCLDFHHISYKTYPERAPEFWQIRYAPIFEMQFLSPALFEFCPDLIFISSGHPGQWLSPFMLSFPVIHVHHNCVPPVSEEQRNHMHTLFSRSIPQKHCLATVSKYAAQCMEQNWGIEPAVVQNVTRFPEAVRTASRKHGKSIISVGHVVGYKNPDVWLQVALNVLNRHPDASFTWFGEGQLLENARNVCKDIPQIVFPGACADIAQHYRQSSILFHPSALDSSSLVALEAMSFGLPCVASNVGGIPEIISHGKTGYMFGVDDIDGMTNALCDLLERQNIADQIGTAAQKSVLERFMPSVWEENILALIRRILE